MKYIYICFLYIISTCYTVSAQNISISKGTLQTGHYYVDLGLSVPWATCNVGASYPQNTGDYFSWAEISTKKSYTWENYKYLDKSRSQIKNSLFDDDEIFMTKYNSRQSNSDNKRILDKQDDVVASKWGGAWRMPTEDECKELVDKCQWKSVKYNGVNGFKVTGPNKNSIFLPTTGHKHKSDVLYSDVTFLWSSSLNVEKTEEAIIIAAGEADIATGIVALFSFGLTGTEDSNTLPQNTRGESRYYGIPVRPVYGVEMHKNKNQKISNLNIKSLKEHVFGFVKTQPVSCDLSAAKYEIHKMFGFELHQCEKLLSWSNISKPVGYNVVINGKKIDGAYFYVDGKYKSWSYEIFDLKSNTTFSDSEKFIIKLRQELETEGYTFTTTSASNNTYTIESNNKDINISLECCSASKFSTHDSWKITIDFRTK